MKKKLFLSFLVLLTVFNLSIFGSYFYNKYFSNESCVQNNCSNMKSFQDSLKLSENQACKMNECQQCFKENSNSISSDIRKNRYQLLCLLKEKNPDEGKVNILLNKIDSLQYKFLREVVNNLLAHKKMLDESQNEKFFSMILNEFSPTK